MDAGSRDDFIIAIRSAFLKKGNQQRFSLIFLIILSLTFLVLERINFKPINYVKIVIKETGLPVHIADDPLTCVAIGTGKALEQEETFSTMLSEY